MGIGKIKKLKIKLLWELRGPYKKSLYVSIFITLNLLGTLVLLHSTSVSADLMQTHHKTEPQLETPFIISLKWHGSYPESNQVSPYSDAMILPTSTSVRQQD